MLNCFHMWSHGNPMFSPVNNMFSHVILVSHVCFFRKGWMEAAYGFSTLVLWGGCESLIVLIPNVLWETIYTCWFSEDAAVMFWSVRRWFMWWIWVLERHGTLIWPQIHPGQVTRYWEPKATEVKQSIAVSLRGCATHWSNVFWTNEKLIFFGDEIYGNYYNFNTSGLYLWSCC